MHGCILTTMCAQQGRLGVCARQAGHADCPRLLRYVVRSLQGHCAPGCEVRPPPHSLPLPTYNLDATPLSPSLYLLTTSNPPPGCPTPTPPPASTSSTSTKSPTSPRTSASAPCPPSSCSRTRRRLGRSSARTPRRLRPRSRLGLSRVRERGGGGRGDGTYLSRVGCEGERVRGRILIYLNE